MKIVKNKRGMYEYILTKSVMLIFILALVGLFYSLYNNMSINSAGNIVQSEAASIERKINDIIGSKVVSSSGTIYLKQSLKVGKENEAYRVRIDENGVLLEYVNYPYAGIKGFAPIGYGNLQRVSGSEWIDCSATEIARGAKINIEKWNENRFDVALSKTYMETHVKIDAPDCMDSMELKAVYYQD